MKCLAVALSLSCLLAFSCGGGSPETAAPVQPGSGTTQAGQSAAPAESPDFTPAAPDDQAVAGTTAPGTAMTPVPGTAPVAPDAATTPPAATTAPGTTAPGTTTTPAIQRKIGELVYAEGSVTVHRAGAGQERIDIGDVVRQYDVLITGKGSKAEVALAAGTPGGASVKLAENTAFYFDTKELSPGERKTVLQLLGGAIAVKVDKLAGGTFSVATDAAVMGVRGTVFVVDTVPDGSLLVTCSEGSVAVEDDGSSVLAKPGTVASQPAGEGLSPASVQPAELSAYRSGWKADAFAGFAANAIRYTSGYAAAIDGNKAAFLSAYARLKAQSAILSTWRDARAAGKVPRFTDWTAEKKAVAAVIFDCLEGLFLLERPYYRLVELKTWHESGTGAGTLADGRDSAAFFRDFEAANRDLVAGMSAVREALDLFSWASAGSPLGDFFGAKAENLGSGALFLED